MPDERPLSAGPQTPSLSSNRRVDPTQEKSRRSTHQNPEPALLPAAGDSDLGIPLGTDGRLIDLTELSFVGRSWHDVRTARNRAGLEGITMIGGRLSDLSPESHGQIDAISREWLHRKPIPETGVHLGTVEHAMDPEMPTHLAVDAAGQVQGVTTWLPIHRAGRVIGWTLDVMRRRPAASGR